MKKKRLFTKLLWSNYVTELGAVWNKNHFFTVFSNLSLGFVLYWLIKTFNNLIFFPHCEEDITITYYNYVSTMNRKLVLQQNLYIATFVVINLSPNNLAMK